MQIQFDKKILIHQNLCLASKLNDCKSQVLSLKNQLQEYSKAKGVKDEKQSQKKKYPCCQHHTQLEANKILIQKIAHENSLLKLRITLMSTYQTQSFQRIISQNKHLCYCGGLKLNYYSKKIEELIALQSKRMQIEAQKETPIKVQKMQIQNLGKDNLNTQKANQIIRQNKVLTEKLKKSSKKIQQCKLNHKFNLDYILESPMYIELKNSCKKLLIFCSQLISKQKHLQSQFQSIEKERVQKIEQMLKKLEFPVNSIKCEDFLMKSQIVKRLQNINQTYGQVLVIFDSIKKKIRKFSKFNQALKSSQMEENIIKNSTDQQFTKSLLKQTQTFILQWMNNDACKQYCVKKDVNLQEIIKVWKKYVRSIRLMREENIQIRRQLYDQQKQLSKKQQGQQIKDILTVLENKLQQIYQKFKNTKYLITEAEFKFSITNAQEHFKHRKEVLKRQDLERHILQLNTKIPLCMQMVQESTNLTNLIDVEKLQNKQKEGIYLGQISSLKNEIQQKNKLIGYYQDNIRKYLQEINKHKLEIDKLREKINNDKGVETEGELKLKQQIEAILKKMVCRCGRGNQATVTLACKHIFCKSCIQGLVKTRKRECPLCCKKFSQSQVVHFMYN